MKKILLVFILLISFGIINNTFASFSISPLKFEFDIDKNSSKKEKIKLTNSGDTPITLYSSKEDFIAGDDTGTPKFVKQSESETSKYSLSNWIELEDKNLTLAPKESKEVYFTIKVPTTSEPGGHYGAIFFSPGNPAGGQVAVVQRLGVLILVNVPGEVLVSGEVKDFQIGQYNKEKKLDSKTNFNSLPIIFQTIFQNNGNIHLKPSGKITLTDENGEVLKNIGKETLYTPAGTYLGEKMVDYLPINDVLGNVLPNSERKFDISWEGFGYNILNDDGTKEVKFKSIEDYYADKAFDNAKYLMFWQKINSRVVNKKITASFDLSYEAKNKEIKNFEKSKDFYITYNEKYIGINYYLIFTIGIILILILAYFVVIVPKQKAKKEQELKEKILKELNENK
ncbi:DUF916 domain-containing protein [Candidatus Gracilibacteria bacterium]|nr:DUF916 domain-containing protein [Candidatus Gracilibacteria bacterium]